MGKYGQIPLEHVVFLYTVLQEECMSQVVECHVVLDKEVVYSVDGYGTVKSVMNCTSPAEEIVVSSYLIKLTG